METPPPPIFLYEEFGGWLVLTMDEGALIKLCLSEFM